MKLHDLKSWPMFFQPVVDGVKLFEVRKNDRFFEVGDILNLREFDFDQQRYTGQFFRCVVTYICDGGRFGIESGFVVLGVKAATTKLIHTEKGQTERSDDKIVVKLHAANGQTILVTRRYADDGYTEELIIDGEVITSIMISKGDIHGSKSVIGDLSRCGYAVPRILLFDEKSE